MSGDDVVQLRWDPPENGASGFVVETAAPGATFVAVASTPATELRAIRVPAGSWQVRVRGVGAHGTGDASNTVSFTAVGCRTAPAAPPNLVADVVGFLPPRTVTLRWSPVTNAEGYAIDVSLSAGGPAIASFITSDPEPRLQGTAPAGQYHLRLRARNACGESASTPGVVTVP